MSEPHPIAWNDKRTQAQLGPLTVTILRKHGTPTRILHLTGLDPKTGKTEAARAIEPTADIHAAAETFLKEFSNV